MKNPKEMTDRELQENILASIQSLDVNIFKIAMDTQQIQRNTNTIKVIILIVFILTIIFPFAFLFLGFGALFNH